MANLAPPVLWQDYSDAERDLEPPEYDVGEARPKRAKVALACQRCKKRKQKCDGDRPCSKCHALKLHCEYVMPQKPMPFGKNHYIDTLERRIADLEVLLAAHGIQESSADHWPDVDSRRAGAQVNHQSRSHVSGASSADSDERNPDILKWQSESQPVVSILRSLSLDANGSGYIGATSHLGLGRLFSFLQTDAGWSFPKESRERSQTQSTASRSDHQRQALGDISAATADRLFAGYLKHIATRFPIVHTPWARDVHRRRHFITSVFEKTILRLIYAAAGRFLQTAGESLPAEFDPRHHFDTAIASLDVLLECNDLDSVRTLMLMAIYCLRDHVGAGAWTYSRTALLIAIEHGLHRQPKSSSRISLETELRKRLFWACYVFDRQISIPFGRPLGISDRDIDLELPLDVNEDCAEAEIWSVVGLPPKGSSTSLTSFIKTIELRKIESEIQQSIYRVDCAAPVDDAVVESFILRLADWKKSIPEDTASFRDADAVPFDGYDLYLVFYYKCLRLLLYPSITGPEVNTRFLRLCAQACSGVCGAYKRLHQSLAVGYSSMAVQTVFMAGLTLVYCIWRAPDEMFDMATSGGVNDCSVVLFVMAERVATAKKYRNAFETIRQRVMDHIAQQPRSTLCERIPGLSASVVGRDLEHDQLALDDASYEQLSHIIADMSGEDAWATPCGPQSALNFMGDDFNLLWLES